MIVQDLMRSKVITINLDATYEEAATILYQNNLSGAPVVDKDEKMVGFVSEKDLFRILFPYYHSYYQHPENYTDLEKRESKAKEIAKQKVQRFMNKSVITVAPDMPILSAGAIMLANNIHKLPVVKDGEIIGMIEREQIYKKIFEQNFFNAK